MPRMAIFSLVLVLVALLPATPPVRRCTIAAGRPCFLAGHCDHLRCPAHGGRLATTLPRDRVTLSHRGQVLPLTDTGSGFAFLGLPSESRWTREAVYWLSVADAPAPRASLPTRLPVPLMWGPDLHYERHQATARGDSWWAGELRGNQAVSATLTLPAAIPTGTPLQLRLRPAQAGSSHAVSVAAGGQPIGTTIWSDGPAGAQVVTRTVSLPARPAGLLRVDLTLASTGDTILVDDLTLPTVFPPASPVSIPDPAPATALPGNLTGVDLLIVTHAALGFRQHWSRK